MESNSTNGIVVEGAPVIQASKTPKTPKPSKADAKIKEVMGRAQASLTVETKTVKERGTLQERAAAAMARAQAREAKAAPVMERYRFRAFSADERLREAPVLAACPEYVEAAKAAKAAAAAKAEAMPQAIARARGARSICSAKLSQGAIQTAKAAIEAYAPFAAAL